MKIYTLQKATEEIKNSFADRLVTETNTLIDISTTDRYRRGLANAINIQLRKLCAERRRFRQGDTELKNAVANIAHDLRTPLTAICGYLDLLDQEEKSETVKRYLEVIRMLDRSALTRVFSNLLNNALKYSDGDLDIVLTDAGNIIFSNAAVGLNEIQVGRLFDRFYTVEAARKSTGLGLAIARTLIEQMHGTI